MFWCPLSHILCFWLPQGFLITWPMRDHIDNVLVNIHRPISNEGPQRQCFGDPSSHVQRRVTWTKFWGPIGILLNHMFNEGSCKQCFRTALLSHDQWGNTDNVLGIPYHMTNEQLHRQCFGAPHAPGLITRPIKYHIDNVLGTIHHHMTIEGHMDNISGTPYRMSKERSHRHSFGAR